MVLVYNSVVSANRNSGIPHFESKWEVEQHIARIGTEAAIVAPVYFMENLLAFQKQRLVEDFYATPLRADLKLSQIALNDLAGFAVLALENRERFVRKRIDVASDDLTGAQAAAILAKVLGKPIKYFQVPLEEISKMSKDLVKMYEWFERVGYHLDIAALHGEYPEADGHTYEAWAREQDWEAILSESGHGIPYFLIVIGGLTGPGPLSRAGGSGGGRCRDSIAHNAGECRAAQKRRGLPAHRVRCAGTFL